MNVNACFEKLVLHGARVPQNSVIRAKEDSNLHVGSTNACVGEVLLSHVRVALPMPLIHMMTVHLPVAAVAALIPDLREHMYVSRRGSWLVLACRANAFTCIWPICWFSWLPWPWPRML